MYAIRSYYGFDLVRAKCPHARIEIVTGVGHFPQIEAADRVNALIEKFVANFVITSYSIHYTKLYDRSWSR